jgi:phage baseplate assembly protein W
MSKRIIYSDFDVNLGLHPITKDVIKKTNENSVRQSLRLLLQTIFYDRKWHPEIGCNLNALLFGQLDAFQLYTTQEEISRIITYYEPRITLQECTCEVSPTDSFKVILRLVYYINMLDKTDTYVYTINRLR